MPTKLRQLDARHFTCSICDFSNTAFNLSNATTLNCRGCSNRITIPRPIISSFQKNTEFSLPAIKAKRYWKRPRKHSYAVYAATLAVMLITLVLMTIVFSFALNQPRKLLGFVLLAGIIISFVYPRKKFKSVNNTTTRLKPAYIHKKFKSVSNTTPRLKPTYKTSRVFPFFKSESYIKQMSGREFEEWFTKVLRWNGYQAKTTPKSKDGGKDIVIYEGSGRRFIECKRWKDKVPVEKLRQLLGVMVHEGVTAGGFVCPGGFTKDAIEFCKRENIILWDMAGIMRLQQKK